MYTRANVIREEVIPTHTFIDFKLTGLRHPLIGGCTTATFEVIPSPAISAATSSSSSSLTFVRDHQHKTKRKVTSSRETD